MPASGRRSRSSITACISMSCDFLGFMSTTSFGVQSKNFRKGASSIRTILEHFVVFRFLEKNMELSKGEPKAGWLGTTLKIHFIAFLILRVIYTPCRKIGKY